MENKVSTAKEIAAKIIAILAAEGCTVSDSQVVLREAAGLIGKTVVTPYED